jgi:hypothetical protein
MKEPARDLMNFLLANGEWIYYALLGAIALILAFSAFRAYKAREEFVYQTTEKPLSASEYFMWATSVDEELTEDDYFTYREQFSVGEPGEEEPTRFEYIVETYFPKLIKGCIFSLILMALVAAPYFVIRYLA